MINNNDNGNNSDNEKATLSKKLRALQKKLRQIDILKEKYSDNDNDSDRNTLSAEQIQKINTEPSIRQEMKEIEEKMREL